MKEALWFDSHCHLDALDEPPDAVVSRARAAGVTGMVTIGTDLASSRAAVDLAAAIDGVWATVGIDPQEADGFDAGSFSVLAELAKHPAVVGIGETGLDFFRDHVSPGQQRLAFQAQIELAIQIRKTLVLHVRDAHREVIEMLQPLAPFDRLVFHCFSGGPTEAKAALDLGGHISFAGNVSFKSADTLRDAARFVPLDRLLLETDSPFLAPIPHRGKKNEPGFVVNVGAAVAEALGMDAKKIASATTANALRVFGLASTS